jgi:hypothetical protein
MSIVRTVKVFMVLFMFLFYRTEWTGLIKQRVIAGCAVQDSSAGLFNDWQVGYSFGEYIF